jgi:hypothetical protein
MSEQMSEDKVISYSVTRASGAGERKEVSESLAQGYRVIDVLTTSYHEGAIITLILSKTNLTPYQYTKKAT